ncbi:hypothetical protein NDU88_003144 [Pleurodeles waltl]|uniref:Uncharacterized protein n=1 Tax=Pleurodeles waltl TaxID=8319 RepID=A0AAV7LHP7_PLEWA|nr:hypothetical protein NDU88_003144 [Pleurodeles waltl]
MGSTTFLRPNAVLDPLLSPRARFVRDQSRIFLGSTSLGPVVFLGVPRESWCLMCVFCKKLYIRSSAVLGLLLFPRALCRWGPILGVPEFKLPLLSAAAPRLCVCRSWQRPPPTAVLALTSFLASGRRPGWPARDSSSFWVPGGGRLLSSQGRVGGPLCSSGYSASSSPRSCGTARPSLCFGTTGVARSVSGSALPSGKGYLWVRLLGSLGQHPVSVGRVRLCILVAPFMAAHRDRVCHARASF